jgi:hypothetical protein
MSRLAALLFCLLLAPPTWASVLPISLKGLDIKLSIFSTFVLPGETVQLEFAAGHSGVITIELDGESLGKAAHNQWAVQAPDQPGDYQLLLRDESGLETKLNLIVMVPATEVENGRLNGYRIGAYPAPRVGHEQRYTKPRGFVQVTQNNRTLRLSPHFTLEQFLCKQASGYPKYLVLQEKLLALAEAVIQVTDEAGFPAESLGFISAYRTPWYNRQIGNVANSRHIFGDALDWYIDVNSDGRMDDVNRDQRHDGEDSRALFALIDAFLARPGNEIFTGGLGRYKPNSAHGGFVHMDTRGYRARW